MKRYTKDEVRELLAMPNGAEKLVSDNTDIDKLFDMAVELFIEEGAASALLIRLANKKQLLFKMSQNEALLEALHKNLMGDAAKLRRNSARLMGAIKRPDMADVIITALKNETQRFVRPSMLLALGSIGGDTAAEYLRSYNTEKPTDETERKHYEEELNALNAAIRSTRPRVEHSFNGLSRSYVMELRSPDMMTHQLSEELGEYGFTTYDIRRNSLKVNTQEYETLYNARCFKEVLFPIVSGISANADIAFSHSTAFLQRLMKDSHSGEPPYRFRVEVDLECDDRRALIRQYSDMLEGDLLKNSPSDYEVELRIEGNMRSARLYAKLFTYKDMRFAYRNESIPASIDPSVAAAILRLASDYLSVNARVIDPCCGSGTLLIERGLLSPCSSLTGVDISHKAVEIARRNTVLSGVDAKYTVNDILRFVCHRPYDELICNLPFGNRVGSHSTCETLYAGLIARLPELVKKGGIAILYTMEFTLLKRLIREKGDIVKLVSQHRTEAGGLTPMVFILQIS